MTKNLVLFIIGIILLIIGGIIGGFIFHNVDFSQLEVLRLMLMFLGSLLTLLAVIVSLEKESLLNYLHPVKLEVVMSDDGLSEDADLEQTIVKATEYSGILSIVNNSAAPAMDVTLEIINVSYKQGSNYKPFHLTRNCFVNLNGNNRPIDIHSKRNHLAHLFSISAPNAKSTPDKTQENAPTLVLFGLENMSLPKKTNWQIKYRLSHSKGAFDIVLEIEWDGSWKNRKSEMQTCCSVKLH